MSSYHRRVDFDSIDDMFTSSPRKARTSSTVGGVSSKPAKRVTPSSKGGGSIKGSAAKQAGTLASSKASEVMVKITGNSKDTGRVKAHADYISRNGQVEVIDQDGNKYQNKQDVRDLVGTWAAIGIPETEGKKREALHVMLSMPRGSNEDAVLKSAKSFAEQEFDGHKYFMALHHETDEQGKRKHPHVHICVMSRDMEGRRLNPRKQDLQSWRIEFARHCREHGLNAIATPKRVRAKTLENEPSLGLQKWAAEAQGKYEKGRNRPKSTRAVDPVDSLKNNKLNAPLRTAKAIMSGNVDWRPSREKEGVVGQHRQDAEQLKKAGLTAEQIGELRRDKDRLSKVEQALDSATKQPVEAKKDREHEKSKERPKSLER